MCLLSQTQMCFERYLCVYFEKIFFLIQHQLFDFPLLFIEILSEALLCVFVIKGVCVCS